MFAYIPLNFEGGNNTVDAAIALSSAGELGKATPLDGYGTPNSATVAALVGTIDLEALRDQAVQKYGRTTGLTTGTVGAVNVAVNVGYSSGTARFVDQILVEGGKGGFLKSGDSGSLLVTLDDAANPVGLLFASGRGGKIAIANRIDLVLDALGVTIDGKP